MKKIVKLKIVLKLHDPILFHQSYVYHPVTRKPYRGCQSGLEKSVNVEVLRDEKGSNGE